MKLNFNLKKVQLVLIIAMLLCLLPMPYGYYTLTRVFVIIYFGFRLLTTRRKSKKDEKLIVFYIVIILLFQPFIKLPLGRQLWNILDIVLAIWLLLQLGKRR